VRPELLDAAQHARAAEQLHVGVVHVVVCVRDGRVEVCAADEVVERANRRPAPHLVVERAIADAAVGPGAAQAEVPAENERHLALRIFLRARDLLRVLELVEREVHRLLPDVGERLAEDRLLEPLARLRRDGLEGRVLEEELVELGRARREHGALLEHLQLDARLEHVGGGGHHHVAVRRLGQLLAHLVARARLACHLVDGAGDDEVGAHGESRRDRLRAADATASADTHAEARLGCQPVAVREDHREQHNHVPVVGVAAAVRLDADVVAHWHRLGERRLLGRHLAFAQQLLHQRLRRWAQRHLGELGARHLEDDGVVADGPPGRRVAREASDAVAHHVRGECHEGGRLDDAHAAVEEKLDVALFEQVVVRRVDQVDGEGLVAERRLDLIERRRHAMQRQAAGAEGREHAALACGDDQIGRGDALGHRARVHREVDAVGGHEGGRAATE